MPTTTVTSRGISAVALLDAMPDATAVLDTEGTIVAVNHAWRMFGLDNGGSPDHTGVGVNYLQVCAHAAAAGCADGAEVAARLRAVLSGDSVERDLEYPCPSPEHGRWFLLRMTAITGPDPGVLVSHINISRRKNAEQDNERRASEDPLTSLANRSRFIQRLDAALTPRPGRPVVADVGVFFLDLDGFKPVNDSYGHAAGDEVLQTTASRLISLTRGEDTVSRFGGDEFAIVTPRTTASGVASLAERIRVGLLEPHYVHGRLIEVGASVGSYLASPGEKAADALHRADEAMYAAKRARPSTDHARA